MAFLDRGHLERARPVPMAARARGRRVPMGIEVLESRMLLSWMVPGREDIPAPLADRAVATSGLISASPVSVINAPEPPDLPAGPVELEPRWSISAVEVHGSVPNRPEPLDTALHPPPTMIVVHDLPDALHAEVGGSLPPGQPARIYRVPIHPETRSVHVAVGVPETADPRPSERFWVIDERGEKLGSWYLPEPGGRVNVLLDAYPTGADTDADLLVGIWNEGPALNSDSNPDSFGLPPIGDFTLTVDRIDASPIPQESPESKPEGGSVSVTPAPRSPRPAVEVEARPFDVATSVSSPPVRYELTLGLGQDAGVLPARSAGPDAGVLADGRSIPTVGRLDGVVIDLTLIDVPPRDGPRIAESGSDALDDGLTTVSRPGGVPLFAAARPPRPRLRDEATSGLVRTSSRPAAASQTPSSTVAGRKADPDAAEIPPRRHPPGAIGLGVAVAVTFGLLLPDLIPMFSPAHPKRPPLWRRWKDVRRTPAGR